MLSTADVPGSIYVGFSVILVAIYLIGVLYFWGVTFSSILNVNICLAFSVCIDYSQHIMQQFLNEKAPDSCKTDQEKRIFKAKQAVSSIGSSVIHCGLSTLCSIAPLAWSATYVFKVFFKCWFCIIFFGMANGFLLMPVILSYIGPLTDFHITDEEIMNIGNDTKATKAEEKSVKDENEA